MSAAQQGRKVTEVFEQAAQSYFEAVRAGVKIQEDIAKKWSDAFKQISEPGEWPSRAQEGVRDSIEEGQKAAEEALKCVTAAYACLMTAV